VRHAGLWLRERFWQAVRARQRAAGPNAIGGHAKRHDWSGGGGGGGGGGSGGGGSGGGGGGGSGGDSGSDGGSGGGSGGRSRGGGGDEPISVSVHVRRGDVTYIDLKVCMHVCMYIWHLYETYIDL
jgi:hypothetical protein